MHATTSARQLAAVCQRIAETQQNMAVPMTSEERRVLRAAATFLRAIGTIQGAKAKQRAMDRAAFRT